MSEAPISVIIRIQRWQHCCVLSRCSIYRRCGLGSPPRRITISPSSVPEIFPVGDTITPLSSQRYRRRRNRGRGCGCFGLLWSREEVQVKFRQKRWGRRRGGIILFLPLLLGSNKSLVACERFISREFSWNSIYLYPCHCACKVSNLFRDTIVTFFTISTNVFVCANKQRGTQKQHHKKKFTIVTLGYVKGVPNNPKFNKLSIVHWHFWHWRLPARHWMLLSRHWILSAPHKYIICPLSYDLFRYLFLSIYLMFYA